MKKISVIIIIYKVEQYLEECLKSVTEQDYDNLEIILVLGHSDKGGEDGCAEICAGYAEMDERIKLVECRAAGAADARNRGLFAATGDYIGFVDGDDYIEPDMYSHMAAIMEKSCSDISVCGRFYEYKNKTLKDTASEGGKVMTGEEALAMVMEGTGFYLHCWDKLYKRELWDGILFPPDSAVEDRVVIDKVLSRAKQVIYDSTPRYHYRERRGSLSRVSSTAQANAQANADMAEYIYKNHPALKELCDKYLIYEYITSIQNVYLSQNTDKSEAADYKKHLRRLISEAKGNSLIGNALKIKMILALLCPTVLAINTKLKRVRIDQELVRFE